MLTKENSSKFLHSSKYKPLALLLSALLLTACGGGGSDSEGGGTVVLDTDSDGVPDTLDAFINDPSESSDNDGDGIGDNADLDDDNDLMPDLWEIEYGLNPLSDDALEDGDVDEISNYEEFLLGTSPVAFNATIQGQMIHPSESVIGTISAWDVDAQQVNLIDKIALLSGSVNTEVESDTTGQWEVVLPNEDVKFPLLVTFTNSDTDLHSVIFKDQTKVISSEVSSIIVDRIFTVTGDKLLQNRFAEVLTDEVNDLTIRLSEETVKFSQDLKRVSDFVDVDNFTFENVFINSEFLTTLLSDNPKVSDVIAAQANTIGNETGLVSGVVTEQGSSKPLSGVDIYVHGVLSSATTDANGRFIVTKLPLDKRLALTFENKSHAINQKIIELKSAQGGSQSIISMTLKPVSERINFATALTSANIAAIAANEPVKLTTSDSAITIKFPASFFNKVVSANHGRIASTDGIESLTLDITKIDPTSERDIFPGNFEARNTRPANVAAANADQADITLESVVLADFTLRDSEGNSLEMPDENELTVRIELPALLQEQYRIDFDSGVRTIPWWSYDEELGEWIREGDSVLLDVNGVLYAEANLNHFSWWNVDQPISTHALVCGVVKDKEGDLLQGVNVTARGISYNGDGNTVTDAEGKYQIRVKKLSDIEIIADYGGIQESLTTTVEDISVATCQDQVDLVLATYSISGLVIDENETALAGVQIVASNGASTYSDAEGNYQLIVSGNESVDITASIYKGDLQHNTSVTVDVLEEDITQNITLSTDPIDVIGSVVVDVLGVQSPLANVQISSSNGQLVTSDVNGNFSLTETASIEERIINVKLTALLPSGLSQEKVYNVTSTTDDINLGEIIFVDAFAYVTGKVVDSSGNPLRGLDVGTNLSVSTKTDANGEFSIQAPNGAEIIITAYFKDPTLNIDANVSSAAILIPQETESISVPVLRFEDISPAYITGTVRELDTSKLLPGIKIVSSYGAQTISDNLGQYTIKAPVNSDVILNYSFDYETDNGENARFGSGSDTATTTSSGSTITKALILDLASNPPVITSVVLSPQVATPGDEVIISVFAKDPDGDALLFTIGDATSEQVTQELLSDGTIKASATVTAGNEFGIEEFSVVVTENLDDPSPSAKRKIQLVVKENSTPAVLTLTTDTKIYKQGQVITLNAVAFDSDNDAISYRWNSGITGSEEEVTEDNNYEFVIPLSTEDGEYSFTVTVEDDRHDANFNSLSVNYFVQSNRAPVITGIVASPGTTIESGKVITLNAVASDPDGQALTYSWLDEALQEVSTARRYRFTAADVTEETLFTLTFSTSDGAKSATQSVVVKVVPEVVVDPTDPNPPPEEGEVSLSGFVSDPEGNPIVGALIELYNEDRSVDEQVSSDISGYYQFVNIAAGTYYVVVSRDGFTISSAIVVID